MLPSLTTSATPSSRATLCLTGSLRWVFRLTVAFLYLHSFEPFLPSLLTHHVIDLLAAWSSERTSFCFDVTEFSFLRMFAHFNCSTWLFEVFNLCHLKRSHWSAQNPTDGNATRLGKCFAKDTLQHTNKCTFCLLAMGRYFSWKHNLCRLKNCAFCILAVCRWCVLVGPRGVQQLHTIYVVTWYRFLAINVQL